MRAENLVIQSPQQAMEIIASVLGVEVSSIEAIWPEIKPRLQLSQGLIYLLEDEVSWAEVEGLIELKSDLNILDAIDSGPMSQGWPERVEISQ